ncbi:diguanylate cyclase/phosphodiesterase with Chase sensor [Tolypothrix tenuis PCC 7101]|uniref:Diguanylate cyclase/phosphodiesterase with Chase sensor n=1 Tax=Tolypothrix tenuis PCC 7101 TaxID=231146 RepID=A0A1Z4N3Q1_9CYAN|nr:EAL domain-containing protein [Aulosira sp. FACHB-113]BAZ00311.1 diguanylate cyclase/phosphodiesterase with Chase sensor [Tolypothrix tenuis PCC 7101]BAZ75768.1 diguanylate cyclase/phosphodiesterase with Chase sensor [Aulosira laxa NIES-50]
MIAKYSHKFRKLVSLITKYLNYQLNPSITTVTLKQSVVIASILITGLVMGVKQLGWLQLLELVSYDQMVRLQPDAGYNPRLLVVTITEADIKEQKQWPLSDSALAQLLAKLQQAQPTAIGLDLYRNIPQPPGRDALMQQLRASNVITINYLGDQDAEEVSPISGLSPEQIGFNDFVVDPDGVVRRNLIYAQQGEEKFYSFSLQLSLKYLAKQGITLKVKSEALLLGNAVFPTLNNNSGGYHDIDSAGYQVMISYRSPENIARQLSLTQVLRGEFEPNWIKDKVVLIGTTAPSLKDLFFTPYSAAKSANPGLPGVLLHAQLVGQILNTTLDQQPVFWFWPEWAEFLWVWTWALVGSVLAWRLRHPLSLGVAGVICLGSLFTICLGIFTQAGWIPLVAPMLALAIATGTVLAYKLLHNTLHDTLTDLPNRSLFLKQLEWVIAETKLPKSSRFAILFLGIDRFKFINESFGHQFGDQFLVNVTQRLKACLGNRGILARVGGDEFAVLLKNINDSSEVTAIVDQLQQKMSLPFKNNGQEIFTSISIGIALNQTELDYEPIALLRDAHTAMYRAKDLGKGRHEVFATGMHTQIVKRFQLEIDLHRAIEQQEFELYYQSIVSLTTARIVGFEALVRWNNPQYGFVSPAEFIPLAEETGLIIPLGQWILQAACQQLAVWQAQFPTNPPLMMSINLSGHQLTQCDLVDYIEQTLQETGLNGESLKLEITETVAMNDVETAISIMLRLRTLNLRLSIDDFGTGYSSLSYLHRFPVNTLKIDRSFVSRMEDTDEDAAIVQTIIMLSHALGMDVVAEGVETAAQQAKLHSLGCEYGQGYFFSKPVDSKTATALLDKQFNNMMFA